MKQFVTLLILLTAIMVTYTNCSTQKEASLASQAISSTCTPPPGVSGSPQSVEQAVALMNALPKPTSIACFIESLSRPLDIYATYSTSSVQPAVGAESPRIFIFKGPLIMGVAPEGIGKNFVEFAAIKAVGQTLKAEVHFPLFQEINPSSPYARIQSGSGTSCSGCHTSEYRDTSITFASAYISKAMRPFLYFKVPTSDLRIERTKCGSTKNDRCDMLRAIFDYGVVNDREFPNDVP